MQQKWDQIFTATLVACALITTGVVIHREFSASSTAGQRLARKPVLVKDWKSLVGQGELMGSTSSPVQLIEFADFECPFCGEFHTKLKALRARYATQLSLTYVHFPIPGHRFALLAARVSECAGAQGRFEAIYDRLFDEQDEFGLKPWSDYANEAGVPDLSAFAECIKQTGTFRQIEAGKQLGAKLNVNATPTLIVNGWLLTQPPSDDQLDHMIKSILAGKSPI